MNRTLARIFEIALFLALLLLAASLLAGCAPTAAPAGAPAAGNAIVRAQVRGNQALNSVNAVKPHAHGEDKAQLIVASSALVEQDADHNEALTELGTLREQLAGANASVVKLTEKVNDFWSVKQKRWAAFLTIGGIVIFVGYEIFAHVAGGSIIGTVLGGVLSIFRRKAL